MENKNQWNSGVPEDRAGAFAAIAENGETFIIRDGTTEFAFQNVIAWTRIPAFPKLNYNPKVFKEPDYGLWIGKYSFDP